MKKPLSIIALAVAASALLFGGAGAASGDTNFAYRIECEVQNQSGWLEPLTWEQGTSPLVELYVTQRARAVELDKGMVARMAIGETATTNRFAVVSNTVPPSGNAVLLQWPTIGTNTASTGAWWYHVVFTDTNGNLYWSGSGSLDIQPTLANGENGLIWQYFSDSTERVTYITTNVVNDYSTNTVTEVFHTTNVFVTTNIHHTTYVYTNLEAAVASVNGQTGDVEIPTNFIPAAATASGGVVRYGVTNPVAFSGPASFSGDAEFGGAATVAATGSLRTYGPLRADGNATFASGASFGGNALDDASAVLFGEGNVGNGRFIYRNFNGLVHYRTPVIGLPWGIGLHSLRELLTVSIGEGDWAGIEMRNPSGGTNATLSIWANGGIDIAGDVQTDGDIDAAGEVSAAGLTLPNGTWNEWPDLSGIEGNAGDIADLQSDLTSLGGRVATNEDAISGLQSDLSDLGDRVAEDEDAIAANAGDIADLQAGMGGYVAKTNGEWVIVQSPDWNGIEWNGERVFGAVLETFGDGVSAEITGVRTDGDDDLVLSFRGADTNRLESCADTETWEVWNDCTWAYSPDVAGVGTVTVHGADAARWYRVVAEGEVAVRTNAAVVSYAPLYVGAVSPENRVATAGDVDASKAAARQARSVSANAVQRRRYEDKIEIEPHDLAWDFSGDSPYIRNLTIGGQVAEWDETEEVGGQTVTNHVTVTNHGSLTLNGVTWTKFPDIGGMEFEEVVDDGEGNITTNTWEAPGSLKLDGIEITSWYDLSQFVGNGFPLEEDADFAGHSADNVGSIGWEGTTNRLAVENGALLFGGTEIKGGSLEAVWGPSSLTNQSVYATNGNAKSFGIVPAASNSNMRIAYDPETSTFSLQAVGGIPGPQGADGVGNILWAGQFTPGMYITNDNTWVSWDGSIWTRAASEDPIMDPPTNNLTWTRVVGRGADGRAGRDGHDAVGLQFVQWSTNLDVISTNMLLSYAGYLLMADSDVPVANPGYPVVEKVVQPGYKIVVPPGADGAAASVFTNATFIFEFDANTAAPAHSLVVYKGYLWYAKQDYTPNETPPPSDGPYWACVGKQGERGPAGANGIGNLRYMGAWNQYRTNEPNDIVRWTRADGRVDWYRATGSSVGARPDTATNYWSKEITSGTDANTIEWKFVDGSYDYTVSHSNELYRAPDGKVWYSVGTVPAGESYSPGRSAAHWRLFVKDGVAISDSEGNTVWRGVWSAGGGYVPGDIVTWQHGDGGKSLYICHTASSNGAAPSDVSRWTEIVSGVRGEDGQRGEDGTATYIYVTNVTTYSHAEIITNTYIVTNDATTAIEDFGVPSVILNRVKFDDRHFDFNAQQHSFTLTESALGVATFNGWRGAVRLEAGNNIVFATDASSRTITIGATVPEIDFSPYATAETVSAVSARVGTLEGQTNSYAKAEALASYVTQDALSQALSGYATTGQITVINQTISASDDNIAGIVANLASLNPVIQTPDGRKWTAQGRYAANGVPTHVWVPFTGTYSAPIRIPMPDGRIFEMAGRYMDGNTNLITHVWEEVTQ